MLRFGLAILSWVGILGMAVGQQAYPVPGPLNYLPYYNPSTSPNPVTGRPPLSPYLNLLNGNNPALNYYYGVRPLLQNQSSPAVQPQVLPPINRGNFFQTTLLTSPKSKTDEDEPSSFRLPSPGGPVSYGNSFGSSRAGVSVGGGFTRPQSAPTASPAAAPARIPRTK